MRAAGLAGVLFLFVSQLVSALWAQTVPAGTFTVQNGSAPWSDRVGQWALAEVPAKFAGTTPLPQQNCGSRALVVPPGSTSVVVGLNTKDVPAFVAAYPTAVLLPEIFSVQNPKGQSIAYSLVYVPAPPATMKGSFQSGLVLFAINTPPPAPGTALPVPKLASVYAPTPLAVPADKSKFEVYLLIGQSNMLGRDTSKLDSQVDNPRIGSMDGHGKWFVAHEPLWGGSGTGPGISFAADILAARPDDVKVGLISCAVGGTPLSRWEKGGDLYERALSRAKLAMKEGTLKGAIWHQGEGDSHPGLAETYRARLTKMLVDLRADLGNPDFPVVVGQLGMFFDPKPTSDASVVRAAIKEVGTTVPHTGFADSVGLEHKGDHLHFTADAQGEFGHRYAKAMLKLQAQK
jgi:hypothetical protein